jgi:hypothetical protein
MAIGYSAPGRKKVNASNAGNADSARESDYAKDTAATAR